MMDVVHANEKRPLKAMKNAKDFHPAFKVSASKPTVVKQLPAKRIASRSVSMMPKLMMKIAQKRISIKWNIAKNTKVA